MLVKVFIRRQIKKGTETEALTLLKRLRSKAMNNEGYISGETLISTDDPQKIMVLSTWHGMEQWNKWKDSEERKAIDSLLDEFQEEPTEYEAFVFSKHRLSAQKGFPEPLKTL
jgi:heme-degrading monooxygenase HmoA